MGYYLEEHALARSQFRKPRRETVSGVIGVHTAEGVMDDIGPDTGAENVASFITHRSDPGSYHDIVDSDSIVELVATDAEAYQMETGDNRHALSVSLACRVTDLNPSHPWTKAAIRNAARAVVKRWQLAGFDPVASARWLSADQVAALRQRHEYTKAGFKVGGLVDHGTMQPYNRTDATVGSRFRDELRQMLVDAIKAEAGAEPAGTVPEEDDTMKVIFVRGEHRAEVIQCNGRMVPEVHVPNEQYLADTAFMLRTDLNTEIVGTPGKGGFVEQVGVPVRIISDRYAGELLAKVTS